MGYEGEIMETTTSHILNEVREILTEGDGSPGVITEASEDHYVAATKLIDQGADGSLEKMFQKRIDQITAGFKKAKVRNERMMKIGVGRTEAVTFLEPIYKDLRKFAKFVDSAADHMVKATGLREGIEEGVDFANQGHGMWEEPVVGRTVMTPDNSTSHAANISKSASALMNARKGQVVKMGKMAYKVMQPAQSVGTRGHVVVLSGLSNGGKGDQYMALVPPKSGTGQGGTVKMVSIGSATPSFHDVTVDLTVESFNPDADHLWASSRLDETQVWVAATEDQVGPLISAAFRGEELSYHLEAIEGEPAFISAMRKVISEGIVANVDEVTVSVHEAANAIQVYDGLGIANQRKVGAMGPRRMLDVIAQMSEGKGGLKSSDMKRGTAIVNIKNPGWGEFRVQKETKHDGTVWWDIRGRGGERVLHTGELGAWKLA